MVEDGLSLAGDLPAHAGLPSSPRAGTACDQRLLEHHGLCGGLCVWPVSGSWGGCEQWEALRPSAEPLSPHLHSEGLAQSWVILGVILLKAAWATRWQDKSRGRRGLEPRTHCAAGQHRAASPGMPCLLHELFLVCKDSPTSAMCGPVLGSQGPFSRESHALRGPWRSPFDTQCSVWV